MLWEAKYPLDDDGLDDDDGETREQKEERHRSPSVVSESTHLCSLGWELVHAPPASASRSDLTRLPHENGGYNYSWKGVTSVNRTDNDDGNDDDDVPEDRTYTHCSIRPACELRNLQQYDRRRHWTAGSSSPYTILIKLGKPSLVGFLNICNRTVGEVEVAVAMTNRRDDYVTVQPRMTLPRFKSTLVRLGFLPCQFIKIRVCGSPASLFFLQPLGLPISAVEPDFSRWHHRVLVDHTLGLFFEPVKPKARTVASSARTVPTRQSLANSFPSFHRSVKQLIDETTACS